MKNKPIFLMLCVSSAAALPHQAYGLLFMPSDEVPGKRTSDFHSGMELDARVPWSFNEGDGAYRKAAACLLCLWRE